MLKHSVEGKGGESIPSSISAFLYSDKNYKLEVYIVLKVMEAI